MRAREPDREGYVDRDGVKLHYELFGDAEYTLVLMPSNPFVHSRRWKAQVRFLCPAGRQPRAATPSYRAPAYEAGGRLGRAAPIGQAGARTGRPIRRRPRTPGPHRWPATRLEHPNSPGGPRAGR
jgi:hypothetical protein